MQVELLISTTLSAYDSVPTYQLSTDRSTWSLSYARNATSRASRYTHKKYRTNYNCALYVERLMQESSLCNVTWIVSCRRLNESIWPAVMTNEHLLVDWNLHCFLCFEKPPCWFSYSAIILKTEDLTASAIYLFGWHVIVLSCQLYM